MTYGEADAVSQGLCSATASTSSSDQMWQHIDQTLNPGGTQAFVDCVKALRGGLQIDFRVNDDESALTVGLAVATHPWVSRRQTPRSTSCPLMDGSARRHRRPRRTYIRLPASQENWSTVRWA